MRLSSLHTGTPNQFLLSNTLETQKAVDPDQPLSHSRGVEIPIGAESAAYLQLGDVTVDQQPVRFTLSETVIPSDKPRQELVNTPKDPTRRATLTDEWITDPFPIKTGSSITFSDEYRMIHREQIRSALPQQSMITIGFELVDENGQVLGTFRTRQITAASIPDDSKGTYRLTVPEGNAGNARIRFLVSSNQPLGSTHQIDLVQTRTTSQSEQVLETIELNPSEQVTYYALHPNFPNPFNPSTMIGYQLPESGTVSIQVYDVTGRLVATLVDGQVSAGRHQVRFDAGSLSSGVYIVRMQTSGFLQTQKMILLK